MVFVVTLHFAQIIEAMFCGPSSVVNRPKKCACCIIDMLFNWICGSRPAQSLFSDVFLDSGDNTIFEESVKYSAMTIHFLKFLRLPRCLF